MEDTSDLSDFDDDVLGMAERVESDSMSDFNDDILAAAEEAEDYPAQSDPTPDPQHKTSAKRMLGCLKSDYSESESDDDAPVSHKNKRSRVLSSDEEEEEQLIPAPKTLTTSDLNETQLQAFKHALRKRRPMLLFGPPGTGKSTVLKMIIGHFRKMKPLNNDEPRVHVTGTSAISGQNLDPDSSTLHSFLGTTPKKFDVEKTARHLAMSAVHLFTGNSLLLITEAFMMNREMFYFLNIVLKKAALRLDMKEKAKLPFAGIRMILDGDPLQIPPVQKGNGTAPFIFQDIDVDTGDPVDGFNALWLETFPKNGNKKETNVFMLTENQRQIEDPAFARAIESLANGDITEMTPDQNINRRLLNSCTEEKHLPDATRLFALNLKVDKFNDAKISALPGCEVAFHPVDCDKLRDFERAKIRSAVLKIGCKVRCTQNTGKVANGQLGVVTRMQVNGRGSIVYVRYDNNPEEEVPMSYIEVKEFSLSPKELARLNRLNIQPPATPKHMPLRVAYAMTIHGVQGLTLPEGVVVDLDRVFHPSMAVVAISRVSSRKKIAIKNLVFKKHDKQTASRMFYDFYKT